MEKEVTKTKVKILAHCDFKRKLERKGSSLIDNLDTYPMVTFRNVSIDKVAICTHNIEKEKDKNLQWLQQIISSRRKRITMTSFQSFCLAACTSKNVCGVNVRYTNIDGTFRKKEENTARCFVNALTRRSHTKQCSLWRHNNLFVEKTCFCHTTSFLAFSCTKRRSTAEFR